MIVMIEKMTSAKMLITIIIDNMMMIMITMMIMTMIRTINSTIIAVLRADVTTKATVLTMTMITVHKT